MKTFIQALLFLFILSSCSSSKSFLHQRYTHFKHSKPAVSSGTKTEYARAKKLEPASAPVMKEEAIVCNTPVQLPEVKMQQLTASAAEVVKTKAAPEHGSNFVSRSVNKAKAVYARQAFNKQVLVKKEQSSKRGLLFGVINLFLSIVLIVVFAFLIVFLVLLLI